MKKQCMFLGSCQMVFIQNQLRNFDPFSKKFDIINLPFQIYNANDDNINYIYNKLDDVDILFLQPVSDLYKSQNQIKYEIGALSNKTIISKLKKKTKIIFIPVMYFDGYFPAIIRPGWFKESHLHNVDINLVKIYYNNKYVKKNDNYKMTIINDYFDLIYGNMYSEDYIINKVNESINRLKKREEEIVEKNFCKNSIHDLSVINVSDFIFNNFKKNILFITINHPSYYLYIFILNQIIDMFEINTIYENKFRCHECDKIILYSAVKNVLKNDVFIDNIIYDKDKIAKYAMEYIEKFDDFDKEIIYQKISNL